MKKIAAVVVLYNPGLEIIDNISSYACQVEKVFIYDNSTKIIAPELLKYFHSNKTFSYFTKGNNMGISEGFNYGAVQSLSKGFDYLLTMDQDSKASSGMVKKLLKGFDENQHVAMVSPFHTNRYNTFSPSPQKYKEVLFSKSSGNLLDLNIYKLLGSFRDDYFIDYVDIEYGFRIALNGFKLIEASECILIHNEADLSSAKFFGRTVYPMNHNPHRMYYKIRNLFYLRKEYLGVFPEFFTNEIKKYFNEYIKILLFEKHKILKLKMGLKGFIDYKRKKVGEFH